MASGSLRRPLQASVLSIESRACYSARVSHADSVLSRPSAIAATHTLDRDTRALRHSCNAAVV